MKRRNHLPLFGLAGLLVVLVGITVVQSDKKTFDFTPALNSKDQCNVSGIFLRGTLTTYIDNNSTDIANDEENGNWTYTSSDVIQDAIEQSEKDETIKAIIMEVDSFGGHPVAGEEIANALKRAQKPTVALIRSAGTSAAYWAATGAQIIYASENSDIGGMGVTFSYLDNVEKNKKEGLTYHEISSAKFKDYGDPDKPLTKEELELLLRDIRIIHENFVDVVAKNRNLGVNKVAMLADGSSMPGEIALTNGLIDKIGGIYEAREYLEQKIGEKVNICWST